MATVTSTIREWSTPEKTKITGEPPGPVNAFSTIVYVSFR